MIEHDITWHQGRRFLLELDLQEPSAAGLANPGGPDVNNDAHWQARDLAGFTAHMQIKNKPGGDAMITLTSEGASPELSLQPGGVVGRLRVSVGATRTVLVTKDGVYDIELRGATADDVEGVVGGKVEVVKEVTTSG